MVFSTQEKVEIVLFWYKNKDNHNVVDSAASVAWNLMIFLCASSFQGMLIISRPLAQFPALKDQGMQTSIGGKHPHIIDPARGPAIVRSGKSFTGAFYEL